MEKNKIAKNAVEQIRLALYNYDLELLASESRINFLNSQADYFKQIGTAEADKKLIGTAISLKKEQTFRNALIKNKNKTYLRIEEITSIYNSDYKDIWIKYFIQKLPVEDIAEKTKYSPRSVYAILSKLKNDIWDYQVNNDEEESKDD